VFLVDFFLVLVLVFVLGSILSLFFLVDWSSSEVTMSESILPAPWGTMIFLLDLHFAVHCRLFVHRG
jgi:hypothetical protein